MDSQYQSVSRRSFLAGTAGAVIGGSVLYGGSSSVRAKSDATGNEQWTHPKGNPAYNAHFADGVGPTGEITEAWTDDFSGFHERDSVCVVDGTVYGAGDKLAAFDAADGTPQWEFVADVPDDLQRDPVSDAKSPTVMDGVVFAPVRMSVFDDDNPLHAAMVAVDADSGEKVWRIDAPVQAEFSDVTAVDGTIYTTGPDLDGGEGRFVYALDPADGSVHWRQQSTVSHNADGLPGHTPVVADGTVFVKEQNGVRALDATSGDVVWEALPRVKEPFIGMVAGGTLFVGENNVPGATIIALDAATGEQQWKQAYASEGYPGLNIGTADANRLYIQIREIDADVIALDRSDGSEAWRASIPQPSKDSTSRKVVLRRGMARVGELLYVGSVGLEPTNGSIVWTQKIKPGAAAGTVLRAVAGGRMYFRDVGMDSRLIVMKGSETQTAPTPTEQTDDPDEMTENDNRQTGTPSDDTQSPNDTPSSPSITGTETTADTNDQTTTAANGATTTATDGPGFGVLAALGGLGVGTWRYLSDD